MSSLLALAALLACSPDTDTTPVEEETAVTETATEETETTTDTGTTSGTTEPTDTATTPTDTATEDTGTIEVPEESPFEACFSDIAAADGEAGPDYDQFGPVVGSHCAGTNHQDITGVERVVFLGDSITVGTLPTLDWDFYRNKLALELASRFGLDAPDIFWQAVDLFNGTTISQESGDFASCAEYGARTDDLMRDDDQLLDCFPEDSRDETTLVVMTIGSNDLSSLTQDFIEATKTQDELWDKTEETMQLLREAVEWLVEPGRFPNGVYVVFTNLYEFTDATGDVTSCPAAGLAGFDAAVTDPALEEMVIWSMEQYMSIATETGTDMLFLLESFCGHGFNYDDPSGRCYRGAGAELWFDLTCIHPNPTGHAELAEMFLATIAE